MTAISRRDALRGAAAMVAAAMVAVPTIAVAKIQTDDADVHVTVAAWHRAYRAYMEVNAWDESEQAKSGCDVEALYKEYYARGYGEVNRAFHEVQNKLQRLKPQTVAGATALMSCPMAILHDREARRRGEDVPDYCWYARTDSVFEKAYAALERLAREPRP